MNSEIISKDEKLKQIKSKFDFKKLKSDYFLRKLFAIMKKGKSLKIFKYNKKLQKRLNLSINDYQKFSQLYTSIEIEVKLDDTKKYKNNILIYIPDEEKDFYHIYFDNSKEEIKRTKKNYLKREKVNTIKIIIDYQVMSFENLFNGCYYIKSICFKKFYRTNIIDMSEMFFECSSLRELDISNLKTNNVTNKKDMFFGCSSLNELNLSNFNTNNVITMSDMFNGCSSLKELNISSFETKNLNNIDYMFNGCSSLKKINISKFQTENVIYKKNTFRGCSDELKNKIKEQNKNIEV